MTPKQLKRVPQKAMIAGVIAGFAEYLAIDVTLLRVIFVAGLLITGFFPLGLAYIIAIFLMPIDLPAQAGDPVIHEHKESATTQ